jgi:UDP-N-acetyl-D-mannosaminuronic acid dehydrogenase
VGLLGLSFKANVSDVRNSPTLSLLELLKSAGIDVTVYDPLVEIDFGVIKSSALNDVIRTCRIVVLCVDHDIILEQLRNQDLSKTTLVDPKNALRDLKSKVEKYVGLSI